MALTLRNKHWNLFKTIAQIDPKFGKIFVPDIGIIRDEWQWCEDNLNYMLTCIDVDDLNTFNEIRLRLLIYCRWRLQNPNYEFEYPIPNYRIVEKKPKSNFIKITFIGIDYFLVSR